MYPLPSIGTCTLVLSTLLFFSSSLACVCCCNSSSTLSRYLTSCTMNGLQWSSSHCNTVCLTLASTYRGEGGEGGGEGERRKEGEREGEGREEERGRERESDTPIQYHTIILTSTCTSRVIIPKCIIIIIPWGIPSPLSAVVSVPAVTSLPCSSVYWGRWP